MLIFAGLLIFVVAIVGAIVLVFMHHRLALRALRRMCHGLDIHETPRPDDVRLVFHTYHGLVIWLCQTPHEVILPPHDARRLLGRLLRFNFFWSLLSPGVFLIVPLSFWNYAAQRRSIARQEARNAAILAAAGIVAPGDAESNVPEELANTIHVKRNWRRDSIDRQIQAGSPAPASAEETDSKNIRRGRRRRSPARSDDPLRVQITSGPTVRPLILRVFGWIAAGLTVLFGAATIVFAVTRTFEVVIGGIVVTLLLGSVAREWCQKYY